jgi:hypothetical protein
MELLRLFFPPIRKKKNAWSIHGPCFATCLFCYPTFYCLFASADGTPFYRRLSIWFVVSIALFSIPYFLTGLILGVLEGTIVLKMPVPLVAMVVRIADLIIPPLIPFLAPRDASSSFNFKNE